MNEPHRGDRPSVADMDYSTFVGFVRERNRPSGGLRTVHDVCVNARLGAHHRMLEVGSNTGFTAVNVSLLTGAEVVGIDVNSDSVAEARRLARLHDVAHRVRFLLGDTTKVPFPNASFDAIWVSNVPSFVDDKDAMLAELVRVLSVGGTLAAVPIYYRRTPPPRLVEEVGRAIGTQLRVTSKAGWRSHFESATDGALELYHDADYEYEVRGEDAIDHYCEVLMAKEHLQAYPADVREATRLRLREFMVLFNENLSYAGFSIMLFQKRLQLEELELFLSRRVDLAPADPSATFLASS